MITFTLNPEAKSPSEPPSVPAFSSIPLSLALCSVTHVMSHFFSVTECDKWKIHPFLSGGCNTFANKLNESIRQVLNHILTHVERAALWKKLSSVAVSRDTRGGRKMSRCSCLWFLPNSAHDQATKSKNMITGLHNLVQNKHAFAMQSMTSILVYPTNCCH